MSKQLARLLKADIQETSDLRKIARELAGKGRGGDTLLAHITPKEVSLLKEAGGAGTVNPDTGLLEFYEDSGGYYDSLPAATQGVYGTDTARDYYQFAPETYNWTNPPSVPPAQEIFDSGYTPPSAVAPVVPTYTGTAPGGFRETGAASEGLQMQPPGTSSIGLQAPDRAGAAYGLMPTPSVATARPVDIGLQGGAGTDTLIGGTRPDYAKAGTAEKPFLSNEQMVRLGLTGGLGVYGAMQQKKAAEQIKKAMGEQTSLGKPYQQQGKAMQESAMRGELTPAAAQQYQALQAQLAQGAAQRGGVGVAQAQAQAEAFKNQLLQGQYDYGLKVSNIGDQIALGAIRTGMQLDQQLNQANLGFYTQLGSIAAGIPTYRT